METLQGICPEGVCIIHLQYMFNAMRTKIAFLDISIHKETKSADFFITLLQQKYGLDNVDIFYDYSFEKKIGKFDYIKDIKEYHTIVFWQKLPSPKILYMLRDKKVIYIPMYDDWHPYKRFLSYLKTFNVRVICFSSRIYNFVYNILHVESLYIQYYISPLPYLVDYTHKKIFRWYRGNISRGDIKKIL